MNKFCLSGCRSWAVLAAIFCLASELIADETELVQAYAARHRIAAADNSSRAFKLRPTPLLYWTNPVRGDVEGGIFLWLDNGRPAAYSGIFVWLEPSGKVLSREFHSLTEQRLVAQFDRQRIWTPGPGIEFKAIEHVSAVRPVPAMRLRQMKQMAARFSVEISHPTEESDKVRLLPTPIYRYGEADSEVLDGAIFAYAQGNDPEALLLIEAHSRGKGKDPQWRYAWARCTTWGVEAKLDGKRVFQVPFYDFRAKNRNSAFFSAGRMSIP